jgi:peptidoglycan/LPS O-acetylase OafA/YrhL
MTRLADIAQRNLNNFDLVRLIAALMVVFGHTFELFKNNGYYDPVKTLFHESAGTLAVYIFFFLSGIFITGSFLNKKDHLSFVRARVLRIWPALIVCTLLTVFVIGPIFTTHLDKYFRLLRTWKFIASNLLLFRAVTHRLPGVFISNHYGRIINGSLWTLPWEIICYGLVFLFGVTRLVKNWAMGISFLLILALLFVFNQTGDGMLEVRIVLFFIAGSLAYLNKEHIPVDYRVCLALIVLTALSYPTTLFQPVLYVTLAYTALVLGASTIFKRIKLPGDYSYGIYIYGFLVQQGVNHLYPNLNPYQGLAITIPVVVVLGALSWHLIERRAIVYGRNLNPKNSL